MRALSEGICRMTDNTDSEVKDLARAAFVLSQILALTPKQRELLHQSFHVYESSSELETRPKPDDWPLVHRLILGPAPLTLCPWCGKSA
jgi:hypothetical protein